MKRILPLLLILLSCSVADISAQRLQDYAAQRKSEIEANKRIEKEQYEKACSNGSLQGYKDFLNKYPNSKYAGDIKNRIADYDLWYAAKARNTIDAYQSYITNSRFKVFESEANDAIIELKSIEKWNSLQGTTSIEAIQDFIKTYPKSSKISAAYNRIAEIIELESINKWNTLQSSGSIAEIQNFIDTYPQSSQLPKAKNRLHELKGINAYKSGNLETAYNEFNAAGGRQSLSYSNRQMYDECAEYHEYKNLKYNASDSQLSDFLRKYPLSKYYDEISNRIAISKAKSLTRFSSESAYNEALRYARDDATRKTVNGYIDASKKAYSRYKSEQRKARWRENGGLVNMGIDFLDWGVNLGSSSDSYMAGYYNLALALRIGNYKTPLQFEVGIRPGMGFGEFNDYRNSSYNYSYSDINAFFRMPLYAKLNLNLFSHAYISGAGFYNAITNKDFERPYAWQIAFGLHWKHVDWIMLYYKKEFGEYSDTKWQYNHRNEDGSQYLGMGLVYYFQF